MRDLLAAERAKLANSQRMHERIQAAQEAMRSPDVLAISPSECRASASSIERLRAAGPAAWEQIAADAGVAKTLPRKLVYGDRENPGVMTIQPLVDYFADVDCGKRALPVKEAA